MWSCCRLTLLSALILEFGRIRTPVFVETMICGGYLFCPPACAVVRSRSRICDRCDCPPGYFLRPDYMMTSCNKLNEAICQSYNARCIDGFCQCEDDSTMILETKNCLKTPKNYGHVCEEYGYALECMGTNLNKTCNLEPGTENFGRCICAQGFTFDQKRKECLWETTDIGANCFDNRACTVAHSHCHRGECMCKEGFVPTDGGLCQAANLHCPVPYKEIQSFAPCFIENPESDIFSSIQGNCTKGEFCLIYHDHLDPDGNHFGHCCKRPTNDDFVHSTCALTSNKGSCYEDGSCPNDLDNFCMRQLYWKEPICCDRPCAKSLKSVNGQCYHTELSIATPCTFSIQCPKHAECVTDSTTGLNICKCRPGSAWISGKCQRT